MPAQECARGEHLRDRDEHVFDAARQRLRDAGVDPDAVRLPYEVGVERSAQIARRRSCTVLPGAATPTIIDAGTKAAPGTVRQSRSWGMPSRLWRIGTDCRLCLDA